MPYLTQQQIHNDVASGFDIVAYISDRNGRKSSSTQLELMELAITENKPFIVIRSKITMNTSASWLSDYVFNHYTARGFSFETVKIDNVKFFMNATYGIDSNGKRYLLWYGMYLSQAQASKSNYFEGWERVSAIVWEECIPQEQLPQHPKVFASYVDTDFYNLLSIRSTVGRSRQIPLIIIGNDISHNLLNTVTVKFNLLERLTANCCIDDICTIDDRQYKFRFRYFDFDGAVNHWLEAIDKKLSQSVNVANADCKNIILKTEYNTYYIYKLATYYYITTVPPTKEKRITTSLEWFKSVDWLNLYTDDLTVLPSRLNYIITFNPELKDDIIKYFGDNWVTHPDFKVKENKYFTTIDIDKLNKMTIQEQLDSPLWSAISSLFSLLKNNVVIYSNVAIKWACEQFEQNNLTLMLSLGIK